MKYFEDSYADDYGLDDERRDEKRYRKNKRGKRGRDSFEARDLKWERWN